jgi:hypothetical protein
MVNDDKMRVSIHVTEHLIIVVGIVTLEEHAAPGKLAAVNASGPLDDPEMGWQREED